MKAFWVGERSRETQHCIGLQLNKSKEHLCGNVISRTREGEDEKIVSGVRLVQSWVYLNEEQLNKLKLSFHVEVSLVFQHRSNERKSGNELNFGKTCPHCPVCMHEISFIIECYKL